MDAENKMTEKESLLIIERMILTAKREQKDNGKGWILWGWLLFLASLFTYVNLKTTWVPTWFFWNLFGIVSLLLLLFSIVRRFFFKEAKKVRTYTGDIFERLNVGFFISLLFLILAINAGVSPLKGFALLISLYAFWILIYGTALNFKPSIIGAFVTWAFGIGCLFVETFEWVMILHGAAVLCGYIIPGYMANKAFKKINPEINIEPV